LDEPSLPHGEAYRPLGRRAQIITILLIIGIGTTIAGVTGWAIGGWFVPVLGTWRPKQIINDIWRESGPRTTDEYGTKDERNNVPNLFLLWWLAWLLMGALYWIATRTSWSAVTIDELLAANALFLAADISSIVAAALAVVFVQRATSHEQESARLLDLIPDDDRTAILRRKSTWVVAACLTVGVAIQGGIAIASLSGSLSSESEAEPELAPGTPAGALVSDNFSTQGAWLVEDDGDLTFDYVTDAYRIFLKKPGLWSSIRALPDEVESLTMEADASAEDIDLRTDFFGISCLTASGESFLFGMSPDGYYTVAFDPGGD
jgi:hypothetical protein